MQELDKSLWNENRTRSIRVQQESQDDTSRRNYSRS